MFISGELILEQPPRPARVYAAAPSNVDVTVVRAVNVFNGTLTPAHEPRFYLHRFNETDYQYFKIDERLGVVKTSRWGIFLFVGHRLAILPTHTHY